MWCNLLTNVLFRTLHTYLMHRYLSGVSTMSLVAECAPNTSKEPVVIDLHACGEDMNMKSCHLGEKEVCLLDQKYQQILPDYCTAVQLYDKAKERARNARRLSTFPPKEKWYQEPSANAIFYSSLRIRDKQTCQIIELISEQMEKVPHVASTICVCETKTYPVFGRVSKLFKHTFSNNVYYWAIVRTCESATFDSSNYLWFV